MQITIEVTRIQNTDTYQVSCKEMKASFPSHNPAPAIKQLIQEWWEIQEANED